MPVEGCEGCVGGVRVDEGDVGADCAGEGGEEFVVGAAV